MGLFARIKAWFIHRPPADGTVPYYDTATHRVVHIPPSELRPGCIQVRLKDPDEIVWVSAEELLQGPITHPPFDEDTRSLIREIHATFAEHRDISLEEWEEGFRRDTNVEREIAYFLYAAEVYRLFTRDEPDAARREDVYRLLMTCMIAPRESIWHVLKLSALTRPEAERIMHRFYGGSKADEVRDESR